MLSQVRHIRGTHFTTGTSFRLFSSEPGRLCLTLERETFIVLTIQTYTITSSRASLLIQKLDLYRLATITRESTSCPYIGAFHSTEVSLISAPLLGAMHCVVHRAVDCMSLQMTSLDSTEL